MLRAALFSLTTFGTCPGPRSTSHYAPRLSGIRFRVEGQVNRWHVSASRYFDHGLIVTNVALVEQVRDGSTLRVRLFLPDGGHQLINIALAGVRCARTSSKPDESPEPWAEEVCSPAYMPSARADPVQAKFFTESRLLQRAVRVVILSLPSSPATPFQTGTSAPPPPASIFIGSGELLFHLMLYLSSD